jgi:hypothetical protein
MLCAWERSEIDTQCSENLQGRSSLEYMGMHMKILLELIFKEINVESMECGVDLSG